MSDLHVRRTENRAPRTAVLIMCEGPSEKVYFDRLARMTESHALLTKVSKDKDPADIIRNCASEADRMGLQDTDVKVAVFDLDKVKSKEEMAELVNLAESLGIRLAVFNLTFEVWLIMHVGSLSRLDTKDDYEHELTRCLGEKYVKSKGLKERLNAESVDRAICEGRRRVPKGDASGSRFGRLDRPSGIVLNGLMATFRGC